MGIGRKEVEHVALLSRLELTESEIDRFAAQLSRILDYARDLDEVDTTGVQPMSHAIDAENVWREDAVAPSLPIAEALANAPSREGNFFKVPKVTE